MKEINKKNKESNKGEIIKIQIDKLKKDILLREKAIRDIYLDKVKGLISDEQFNDLNDSFIKEKDCFMEDKKRLEDLFSRNKCIDDNDEVVDDIYKYIDNLILSHFIVNKFIDHIEVGEYCEDTGHQEVKLYWNF